MKKTLIRIFLILLVMFLWYMNIYRYSHNENEFKYMAENIQTDAKAELQFWDSEKNEKYVLLSSEDISKIKDALVSIDVKADFDDMNYIEDTSLYILNLTSNGQEVNLRFEGGKYISTLFSDIASMEMQSDGVMQVINSIIE